MSDTSVKSEEKSMSDSVVYGSRAEIAGYFRKVREEKNAGRAKFTEAGTLLPDTSVKSEKKSTSDSAVYGSRNTFAEYFRKHKKYEILQPILQKEDL